MTHTALKDFFAQPRHRIHLIGVAGSGMSGIAGLLLALDQCVSGSDKSETHEVERLVKNGLVFHRPHTAKCVKDAELVIYSSAIKPGNAAYDEAARLGIPMVRRADALAAIMANKRGIVVCGMHGKTTTSSMAAHVLRKGGLKPSHYVGAEIPILGTNARWDSEGEFFVAEGDESDGTLINYHPEHAIVLNIEPEHLDFYRDLDAIDAVYSKLISQTTAHIIYCADDIGANRVCAAHPQAISYGTSQNANYRITDLTAENFATRFTAWHGSDRLGEIVLNIPGAHNALNALAVIALATQIGIPFPKIAAALDSFRGARRRFDIRYKSDKNIVVDDYGHHPTEIAVTIATARTGGWKRILAMFQPHRYSRTHLLKDQFGLAFRGIDSLIVGDIYAASEKPIAGVSGLTVVEAVLAHGLADISYHADIRTIHRALANRIADGDLILSLGAGNIHEAAARLIADIETRDAIRQAMGRGTIRLHEPMSKHTTFRIGGPAQFFVEPETEIGFAALVRLCAEKKLPFTVIGRGSNLLVRDGGILGVVACLCRGEFAAIEVNAHKITAGAAVPLKKIVEAARKCSLGSLEWMEGIPGTLGGALRMNAGALGSEIFQNVVSVRICDLDGKISTLPAKKLHATYRDVPSLHAAYALAATLRATHDDPAAIETRLVAARSKRRATQPAGASAGSVFKNPSDLPAGRLIESLGFKDFAVGGARVSTKHANFIINDGNATATEILTLIEEIKMAALRQHEIKLELEIQVIGENATEE